MGQAGDITILLREWSDGNDSALDPLFELIYPQLRHIAGSLMRRERPGHLLQPTGIVNEFYLKLVRQQRLRLEDRAHFLSLAARFMRRILMDEARKSGTRKRDGGRPVVFTEDLSWFSAAAGEQMLDVDRALSELAKIDERKCKIVELRYFLGFTAEETGELLDLSKATVDRELKFARGWIQERLSPHS
jgi:RNA polymerase sigma factor (TIGR02999 family)